MTKSKAQEKVRDIHETAIVDTGAMDRVPFFCVCIPTYNRANFLPEAIESVLSQDFTDFELIICDNASTDNTEEVVKQYQDNRIRYVRYKNLVSMYANHNRCISLASSNWLLYVHSDDHIERGTLNSYHQAILKHGEPDIAIYFSRFDSHVYSHQSIPIQGIDAVIQFLQYGFFPPTCNVFNLDFLQKNKVAFNERTVFADAILLCESCLEHNATLMPVPSVLQTWDMNRGSYKKILTSYDNVSFWKDIALYLRDNLSEADLSFLVNEMAKWDSNTISHLIYRFAFIDWWEGVSEITSNLSKRGISFKSGHYYKHVLILRLLGKKVHKILYSVLKEYQQFYLKLKNKFAFSRSAL